MTAALPHNLAPSARRPRRLAAWMGIWALLLYALIPLGQAVPLGDGGLQRLVICTAIGAQTLPGGGTADSPSSAASSCIVCQLNDLGKTLTFAASCPLVRPIAHDAARQTIAVSALIAQPPRPWFARAPPAYA